MTLQNAITEVKNVTKVETDFHDLGMYGEYHGLIIHFDNGRQFKIRIEEHDFVNFIVQSNYIPAERKIQP